MFKLTVRLIIVLAFGWAGSASAALMNTVSVNGKEWLQPFDFINLSWNDISSKCDVTTGSCAGTLGAIDMTGYTWADVDEVNGLFNTYLSAAGVLPAALLNGPDGYSHSSSASSWAPAILVDFQRTRTFRDRTGIDLILEGFTRDKSANPDRARTGLLWNHNSGSELQDRISTNATFVLNTAQDTVGGWFYRSESPSPPAVPVPSTLFLLGLSLLGICVRRKRATNVR